VAPLDKHRPKHHSNAINRGTPRTSPRNSRIPWHPDRYKATIKLDQGYNKFTFRDENIGLKMQNHKPKKISQL